MSFNAIVAVFLLLAETTLSGPLTDKVTTQLSELQPNGELWKLLSDVDNVFIYAQLLIKQEEERDTKLFNVGVKSNPNSAGFARFGGPKLPQNIIDNCISSRIITKAMEILAQRHCDKSKISAKDFIEVIQHQQLRVLGICNVTNRPDPIKLSDEKILKYRSFDGSYNNLKNPDWGRTGATYPRLLDPDYGNGVSSPRLARSGRELPNARLVSVTAHPPANKFDARLSMATSEGTQLLAHDISYQVNVNNLETGSVSCCSFDESCELPKPLQHTSCMPISIPARDKFFSRHRVGCSNFVRSASAPRSDCTSSWREQINSVTGYIDGSFIYGSNEDAAESLRTFKRGQLVKHPTRNNRMPSCNNDPTRVCYRAGDARINQQVHLASMHMVFFREHNRIADGLQRVNPHWGEEKLFQETRRIVVAVWQNIIFSELLPAILGPGSTAKVIGKTDEHGYTYNYNETTNGATYNDFTIAFRALHSAIPNHISLCDEARRIISRHLYSDMVGNVTVMESTESGYDDVLRGMSHEPMMSVDRYVTSEITDKMFKGNNPYGSDLVAADIQRSRDHGTPGYNRYRQYCDMKRVSTFEELLEEMDEANVDALRTLYEHPDDVDLLVGGLMERPHQESIFGKVFTCVYRKHFQIQTAGDRFFYSNKQQRYPFTPGQLKEIKKSTLTGLFCRNSDNILSMPKNVFLMKSRRNPMVNCRAIRDINLRQWRDF